MTQVNLKRWKREVVAVREGMRCNRRRGHLKMLCCILEIRGPKSKACRQHLEAGKGKATDSPPEPPEECNLVNTSLYAQ